MPYSERKKKNNNPNFFSQICKLVTYFNALYVLLKYALKGSARVKKNNFFSNFPQIKMIKSVKLGSQKEKRKRKKLKVLPSGHPQHLHAHKHTSHIHEIQKRNVYSTCNFASSISEKKLRDGRSLCSLFSRGPRVSVEAV